MSYYCYVAVGHPLHYRVILHGWLCLELASRCLVDGFINSLMEIIVTFQLPINHFACEPLAVLWLACMDTYFNKVMVAISGLLVIMLLYSLVMFSYGHIIATFCPFILLMNKIKTLGHVPPTSLCFHVLWNYNLHLSGAMVSLLSGRGEDGYSALCCGGTWVEPFDLQLEE